VPGQKLVEAGDGIIGNAGEHVGEPGLGIDGDRRKVGGQAATAIGGCGSLIGRNFCPKPVPSVPL